MEPREMSINLGMIPGTDIGASLNLKGMPKQMDVATFKGLSQMVDQLTKNTASLARVMQKIEPKGTLEKTPFLKQKTNPLRLNKKAVTKYWLAAKGKCLDERFKIANDIGFNFVHKGLVGSYESKWRNKKLIK